MDQIGTIFPGRGGGRKRPSPEVYAAMNAGRALAPDEHGTIRNLPRPFDKTRCGGCWAKELAALSLEDYEHARPRRQNVCRTGRVGLHL